MTKIPRYIDDQPKIFFWDLDVFLIFSTLLFMGILTDYLLSSLVVGATIGYLFTKFKAGKPDSYLFHALYWHGFLRLSNIPPSYIRRFIE
ncbi:MAG TPA: type IV conjugative transfer system protein TraL [Candidatus Hydrogenedentes bacterium]|nr:type IV conjugative transfer system protein TraL [Candidatus Hydrogenedentota bacterium]